MSSGGEEDRKRPHFPLSFYSCFTHVLGAEDVGSEVLLGLRLGPDLLHMDAGLEDPQLKLVEGPPLERGVGLHHHDLALEHRDLHGDLVWGRAPPLAPLEESPCGLREGGRGGGRNVRSATQKIPVIQEEREEGEEAEEEEKEEAEEREGKEREEGEEVEVEEGEEAGGEEKEREEEREEEEEEREREEEEREEREEQVSLSGVILVSSPGWHCSVSICSA